jgi:hypothetical protein
MSMLVLDVLSCTRMHLNVLKCTQIYCARHLQGVWHGVSKGVEKGCRLLALWMATPETATRPFLRWSPIWQRGVEYGRP